VSHPEQLGFFRLCVNANRGLVAESRVLEIGSFDVNGSIRALFESASEYCGVDLVPGPGVDRVSFGHELADADGSWDMTLSAECFEHDPHWRATLANMVRLTRAGGLVLVSCASRGRVEHGTRRTAAADSPGTQFAGLDYYANVTEEQLRQLPLDSWFDDFRLWYNPTSCDLYLAAVRASGRNGDNGMSRGALPPQAVVAQLSELMSFPGRLIRSPLRAVSRLVQDDAAYQNLAVPYWNALIRVQPLAQRVADGLTTTRSEGRRSLPRPR
jgi:SAM-dependent methyltransferase